MTLSNEIRVFKKRLDKVFAREDVDYKKITEKKIIKNGYVLEPGELVLGITKEYLNLPPDIAGWLNSRSRFARLGLMVHLTAPFMQPGLEGKQVLEIFNAAKHNLVLLPGQKVCQFVFERCEGKSTYKGKFMKQRL